MIKVVVSSEEERREVLDAFRHIHDSNIDTDIPMVNLLAHLYLDEDAKVVVVEDGS